MTTLGWIMNSQCVLEGSHDNIYNEVKEYNFNNDFNVQTDFKNNNIDH